MKKDNSLESLNYQNTIKENYMLKNSLTKENLKSLKNYPVLESFLEDINTNKDFTKLAEIVKDHLSQSVEVSDHKEEILNILRILKLGSLEEKALEIQNKEGFLYSTYLDTIEDFDATQVFQNKMFEEVCALYDAGEPYEHLVYSSFAYFILHVDPYLTIFTLSPEKWLGKNGEELRTEVERLAYRVDAKNDHRIDYILKKTEGSPYTVENFIKRKGLSKVYLAVKYLGLRELSDGGFTRAMKELSRRAFENKSEKYVQKVKEIKPNLVEFSFKSIVDSYFGIDYQDKSNSPRLSKQLTKARVDYTAKELVAFGELAELLKQYFDESSSLDYGDKMGKLFVDLSDFTIPDIVDQWAFADSCNKSGSSAGSETHLICRDFLGMSFLKIYGIYKRDNALYLTPAMRAYFYKDSGGDIAHAGGYSDYYGRLDHTAYDAWSAIFATLFGHKVDDFKRIPGVGLSNRDTMNEHRDFIKHYSNMSALCDYKKFGTRKEMLVELVPNDSDMWVEIKHMQRPVVNLPHFVYGVDVPRNHQVKL